LSINSKPFVTIGICVRNCENTIGNVIDSVLNQDFLHDLIEIIVVDDGSTDNTLPVILNRISKTDIQVRIYSQKWKGLGPTRNVVVNNAKGDYIIWVDGDTLISSDYVRKQVEFMERNRTVGITQGKCWKFKNYYVPENQSLVAYLEHMGFVAVDLIYGGKPTEKLPGMAGSTCRLKAIKEANGFDENIKGAGEDLDLAYRIRKKGWKVYLATGGTFCTERKKTWSELWNQYLWHGYGCHYVLHKHVHLGKLYDMLPPAAFLAGLLYSFAVYKLTKRKIVFLLPIHFLFKAFAWCYGFMKSHFKSYGHRNKNRRIS